MFGFLSGGGGAGGGGRGSRRGKTWWSIGGGGLLDEEAEDAALLAMDRGGDDDSMEQEQQQEQEQEAPATRGRKGKGGEMTDIERIRQENLRQNQAFLQSLGFGRAKEAALAPEGEDGQGHPQPAHPQQHQQQQNRKRKRGRMGGSGPSTGSTGSSSVPTLEQVRRKWVGREEQIRTLARLLPVSPAAAAASGGALCSEEGAAFPVLLVHGPSGAGKTGVLRDVLPALRLPHAYVRGPEHPTARSFYGAVAAAWMRFIEAQARALGMEGLGYVAGADDVDVDYAEEEARALKGARREERRRRRQEERRQRRRAARDRGDGEGSGTEGEGTGDEESSGGGVGVDSDEDEDSEDEEEDGYWNQTAPLAGADGGSGSGGGGGASLVPLNRVATASGLLHLLRSWRGFQSPSSSAHQQPPTTAMTPFVIVLDGADRLPRGAAHVRHEVLELPAMLAGARGRGGGFLSHHTGGGGSVNTASSSGPLVALTVVLVSETPQVSPGALAGGYGLPVPFSAYSKAEATAILLRSLRVAAGLPHAATTTTTTTTNTNTNAFGSLASAFAALLVGSLYSSTRDVREMRRMAALLSQAYLGPLLQQAPPPPPLGKGGKENEQGQEQQGGQQQQQQQQLLATPTALLERIRPLLARATQHCLHMPAEPLEAPHAQPNAKQERAAAASASASASSAAGAMAARAPMATRFESLLRYGA